MSKDFLELSEEPIDGPIRIAPGVSLGARTTPASRRIDRPARETTACPTAPCPPQAQSQSQSQSNGSVCVNLTDAAKCAYWVASLGVTEDELRQAVAEVGPVAKEIRFYLGKP